MKDKKVKIRTALNLIKFDCDRYEPDQVSVTIQNDQISLRTLVEKFSKSIPDSYFRQGYYDGNENFDNFEDQDLTRSPEFDYAEAEELREKLQQKTKQKKSLKNSPIESEEKTGGLLVEPEP